MVEWGRVRLGLLFFLDIFYVVMLEERISKILFVG